MDIAQIGSIDLGQFGTALSAIAALGTAAFGLVDATKPFNGGISNVGYGFIRSALEPFEPALRTISAEDPYVVVKANWLNGVAKTEQKAATRNLIRLGFNTRTAASMAGHVLPDDHDLLIATAQKIESGQMPSETELAVLARFDAIIDARLDAAFERAEQKFRNTSRVAAAVIAILLAELGAAVIVGEKFTSTTFWLALFIGFIAVPVAPIAKDLSSAISTAAAAFKAVRR